MMARTMARIMLYAAFAVFFASCASTPPVPEGYAVFDTAGDPKASGVRAQVMYPASWAMVEDPARSTIIRTFSHESDGISEHLLLQVMEPGGETEILFGDEAGFETSPRRAKWMQLLGSVSGTAVTGLRAATHQGRYAVFADLEAGGGAGEEEKRLMSRVLIVQDRDRMVMLTCGASGMASDRENIRLRQEANLETVCRDYFDSLKLAD